MNVALNMSLVFMVHQEDNEEKCGIQVACNSPYEIEKFNFKM